jgi:hypothetical protein
MLYLTYIFFWILLPLTGVYFRLKKRISTGFAIGLVLTSFFLGYITANTFEERNEETLLRLINEEKLVEAEEVLRWIVQKNPQGIKNIDISKIDNPLLFKEMKEKLGNHYIDIVRGMMDSYQISESPLCSKIDEYRNIVTKLEHALRLLDMAGSLGRDSKELRGSLKERMGEGRRIISRLEVDCR